MTIRAPFAIALALALAALCGPAAAAPGPLERAELESALLALSEGADGEAAAAAGRILGSPDWQEPDVGGFLASFFVRRGLTPELAGYLEHAALHGLEAERRALLQEALAWALAAHLEADLARRLPDDLGADFVERLGAGLQLLGRIAWSGDLLPRDARRGVYGRLRSLVASHPDVLRKEATLDPSRQPGVAVVRAHLFKIMRDLMAPFDAEAYVEDAGFRGRYAELVREHGLIVLDNNGLDDRQLRAIQDLLRLIPPGLHAATHISQHELLGNRVDGRVLLELVGSPGVNIFSEKVQGTLSGEFPDDLGPVAVPVFCSTVQHELNHLVDAHAIAGNPALAARRDQLIAQAGDAEPREYLRSAFEAGFFTTYPQEFFASIANQYLTGSSVTLLLALKRYDEGWREPLNQFLFFAEVYSQGSDSVPFFEVDEQCRYVTDRVPLGRDGRGHIERIGWPGLDLRFRLDEAGNVVGRR